MDTPERDAMEEAAHMDTPEHDAMEGAAHMDTPERDPIEALLRDSRQAVADDGFTDRVMQAIDAEVLSSAGARASARRAAVSAPGRDARPWVLIGFSMLACACGLLALPGGGGGWLADSLGRVLTPGLWSSSFPVAGVALAVVAIWGAAAAALGDGA